MRISFLHLSIVAVVCAATASASPFGVDIGTKIELLDAEKIEPKFSFKSVPKPHPAFESYFGWQSAESGVCRVMAASTEFENDRYGANVRNSFDKLGKALSEKYGVARSIEVLKSGSIWNEPRDWVMAIRQNERTHAADWENAKSGDESYSLIQIWVEAASSDTSFIMLEYRSIDFEKCVSEIEAGENDSF